MISADLLQRMCAARERLRVQLEPSASVASIARDTGLSTPHFITQFGALFGETPLQCRTRARLERARELLVGSSESATQIALSLGFENVGSFSRRFSRHFGVPPRHYRQAGRPDAAPPSCIALMNLAHAGDRNFGEVAAVAARQDASSSPSRSEPCASTSPASSSTTRPARSTSTPASSAS
ncbi:helix-turn-helix domain-containing protein [Rhizobacter sp. LjRoot28]|uniref:helix-turn-helix domain-containing protein n=1 Tax=Rhizobacter sp. LjRoot28 TaxID=3342309 RepID=UPI003ECE157E